MYDLQVWYWSPFYKDFHLPELHMCEFCLKYFRNYKQLVSHKMSQDPCNQRRAPPGKLIYNDRLTVKSTIGNKKDPRHIDSISVYMVEGKKEPLYCQNLCLLGKLFLDHKTLYHEVDTFQFFVLTENNHYFGT